MIIPERLDRCVSILVILELALEAFELSGKSGWLEVSILVILELALEEVSRDDIHLLGYEVSILVILELALEDEKPKGKAGRPRFQSLLFWNWL